MGLEVDLVAALNGDGAATGVPHGDLLLSLTDAVLRKDDSTLKTAIEAVRNQMGDAALIDTAATIASYNSIVKLASATGIPLEPETLAKTAEIRAGLGIGD